jgi:hypothetical protein
VQAVYIDGYASAFATSSGVLLDPNTYEPVVRERGRSQRSGVRGELRRSGAAHRLLRLQRDAGLWNGEIQLTKTGAGTQLSWHFDEWAAAYLDSAS